MIRKLSTLLLFIVGTFSTNAQSTYAEHSLLSTGKWVKISVTDNGVYQLSASELKKMGFNDPSKVKLYGYNYSILPENRIDDIEDDLLEMPLYRNTPTGNLLFYSFGAVRWEKENSSFTHLNNPYSKKIYYFLTEDTNGEPAEFKTFDAISYETNTQTTTLAHSLYEKDEYSFGNFGRRFYEANEYSEYSAYTYTINCPKAVSSKAQLDISFGAKSSSYSYVKIFANGDALDKLIYIPSLGENAVARNKQDSVNVPINNSKITVKLQLTKGSQGHLDYLRASYDRQMDMSGENFMEFTPNKEGTSVFEIAGADKYTSVWEVSSPQSTCELKGLLVNTKYKVLSENMRIYDNYVAVNTNATFPAPTNEGKVSNQDLHSMSGVDFLIIVPASGKITSEAERLASFHTQHDSMQCAVVSADKIYNEFSSGTPDITAYRRLVKMLYDKGNAGNGRKLKNVLLFGNALSDNKCILSTNKTLSPDDYLLCYESEESESLTSSYVLEEYISAPTNRYSDSYDTLSNIPEVGVGRIPVTTSTEAGYMVDKVISYGKNNDAGIWRNLICILADDGQGKDGDLAYTHMYRTEKMTNELEKLYPNYRYSRIYWDAYPWKQTATGNTYPEAESDVKQQMQEGALIMNYTGHGSALYLSHEKVIKLEDFKTSTTSHLPLWITAACETSAFDMGLENCGTAALLNKAGGAIAVIGTTRAVYGNENDSINKKTMRYLLQNNNGKRYTIGEALSMAKKEILSDKKDKINKANFILLGDPAITLPNPSYSLIIDSINGESTEFVECNISAGEKVTITGHIEDDKGIELDDFTGIISSAIYDNKEKIKSNNNNGSGYGDFTFSDYKRKLYEGSDSIKNGKFSFTFPVPMDNNYSKENGLISLYAINTSRTLEAFGSFYDFTIGGTSDELVIDTIGPSITTLINSNNTIDGQKVNETPTIYIHLSDSSGINASGNGLGHDIVAIIDGKEATTYNLNSYFKQTNGDYTSGKIEFTFPALESGMHTLTVRAFDTFNNMSEMHYSFDVYEGLTKVVEYYDFTGRLLRDSEDIILPSGAYIRKTKYMSNGEEVFCNKEKVYLKSK